eukprot:IDg13494t1
MDYLLLGKRRTHVFNDHRNLLFIFAHLALEPALGRHVISKVQRWALYFSRFSYAIEHISGIENVFADLPTRLGRGYRNDRQSSRVRSLVVQQNDQIIPLPTDLIPEKQFELQLKVMVISHSGANGHRGQDATLSTISEAFWLPGMRAATAALVWSCLHCLITRSGDLIPRPMGTALHGSQPNEVVHLDYIYIGLSVGDHKYLLIMRYDFSSYVWLWPTASCTAEAAIDALTTWTGSFGAMQ